MIDVEQPSKHDTATAGRRTWAELGAVTQAALRCKEPAFWAFLTESDFTNRKVEDEETAAKVVRDVCEVKSRRELANQANAEAIWHDLDGLYQAWRIT